MTFAAAKPPPAHAFEQVVLIAAEESGDYQNMINEGKSSYFTRIVTEKVTKIVNVPILRKRWG